MLEFELNKIENKKIGKIYKPLYVGNYISIEKALNGGYVKKNTELLLVKIDNKNIVAFSKHIMAFHHIAEGYLNEKPYMLTFCVICNSGMVMNPEVNGKMLHFYVAGVYNGMLLMTDKESSSYWDHITGKCLHGKYLNYQLQILHSHEIQTAEELLTTCPDSQYGIPKINFLQKLLSYFQNWKASIKGEGFLPPGFRKSMMEIDNRLPEMEMGIGIWNDNHLSKFYTLKVIKENGKQIIDTFYNHNVLIYISPLNKNPIAIYVDDIIKAEFNNDRLELSNGNYITSGRMFSRDGHEIKMVQPNQMFSRWYGFVLTFPNCKILNKTDANVL